MIKIVLTLLLSGLEVLPTIWTCPQTTTPGTQLSGGAPSGQSVKRVRGLAANE
jgi:hypothetical protein